MPFSYNHAKFLLDFNDLIKQVQNISDDLFNMSICLKAGDMPYSPPPTFFDAMETIVPEDVSELIFAIPPSNHSIASSYSGFDAMRTFGKYE
jgi:hypothetical protein